MLRADARHGRDGEAAFYGPLTAEQYDAAVRAASRDLTGQTHLTSATAVLVRGRARHGNLGAACLSGHEIKIRLTGRFPNINVGGGVQDDGQRVPHGLFVTTILDAATLQACVTGVSLGHGTPYPHAADLMPALSN